MNYKDCGVDIDKGDYFIEKIKPFVKETYTKNVFKAVGGFAALYELDDRFLATGTDGVGTKLKLASELNKHTTIGIDLVAMSVNDILCTGATPLFFLDYLATSKLDLQIHTDVIKGIAQGCSLAECGLIGGETAEMPGMYQKGEYDLAGFCVGDIPKDKLITGANIKAGMKIYGLSSSGFHSNGYSLIRELIKHDSTEIKEQCLTPTKIYVSEIKEILKNCNVYGMAHITGGGLNNIKRINKNFGYQINFLPPMPIFMEHIIERSSLGFHDKYTTFNMGIGFAFIADNISQELMQKLNISLIGEVSNDFEGVRVFSQQI